MSLAQAVPAFESPVEDKSEDKNVVISRVIGASPEVVFRAWTEPKFLVQWWGPASFVNPVCDIDPHPMGAWRIVMRSPDGEDYPIKGEILEIDTPKRLVMTMDCSEHPSEWHERLNSLRTGENKNPKIVITTTARFEAENSKTKLTIKMEVASADDYQALLKMGAVEGWQESLDRLERLMPRPN